MSKKIELSDEQQIAILNTWNNAVDKKEDPPTLLVMTQAAFPDLEDTRSPEGVAVRLFLEGKDLVYSKTREKLADIVITDEQKIKIGELLEEGRNSLEISRIIFNNTSLKALSKETQTISKYVNTLPAIVKDKSTERTSYRPPKSQIEAIARVNKTVLDAIKKDDTDKENIKRYMNGLIKFLHSKRFSFDYDSFSDPRDKELYEDTFIKYIWDKPDLTQEDVDSYCNLCAKTVAFSQLNREEARISQLIEDNIVNRNGESINMSLFEHLDKIRDRRDKSITEQEKIKNSLAGTRSERLKGKLDKKATFADVVQMCVNEDKRKNLRDLTIQRRETLSKEIQRLYSMDDLDFEIHGISPDEIING